MKNALRVAAVQLNPCVGDLKGNADRAIERIRRCGASKVDLAVFPELTLTGYPPEDLLFRGAFIRENRRQLLRVARSCRSVRALIGFVDRDTQGRLYNAAAFLESGRLSAVYRKRELPNYGVFDEKRYFSAGAEPLVVRLHGRSVGVTICEDIWVPESFARRAPYAGTSLIVNLSASPYHQGKPAYRRRLIGGLAERTGSPVLYVNLVGGQDELVFDGGSLLADRQGKICAEGEVFREDLMIFDLDRARRVRVRAVKPRPVTAEEEIYRALCLGTRDYVDKNGFRGVLVGISGGIDSALVAKIAVSALGASRVTGVTMPSRYTSKETLADSHRLAKNLKIRMIELPIEPAFRAMLESLSEPLGTGSRGTTEENLQARIRGNFLMALSNRYGDLVLTTGNKSEMATGYCTLYGDMAGGFAVLKDIPKTLVYRVSRYANRSVSGGVIPEGILRRAPTAELRHGQKDQDSLPPYPLLDRILKRYIEEHRSVSEIVREGFDLRTVRKVAGLVDRNEYKRRQAPPGVKITPLAFGRDRRMPITQRSVI